MITLPDLLPALRALGQPPLGNPGAAHAYASRLRAVAGDVNGCAAGARRNERLENFSGPAADRYMSDIRRLTADLAARSRALEELAARVDREATALESQQHAWRGRARAASHGAEGVLRTALSTLGWRMP